MRIFLWLCFGFGLIVFGVCFYYALIDWKVLQTANEHFLRIARQSDVTANQLFIAESRQNVHRLNLFADGVWALQGLILSAIGAAGLAKSAK